MYWKIFCLNLIAGLLVMLVVIPVGIVRQMAPDLIVTSALALGLSFMLGVKLGSLIYYFCVTRTIRAWTNSMNARIEEMAERAGVVIKPGTNKSLWTNVMLSGSYFLAFFVAPGGLTLLLAGRIFPYLTANLENAAELYSLQVLDFRFGLSMLTIGLLFYLVLLAYFEITLRRLSTTVDKLLAGQLVQQYRVMPRTGTLFGPFFDSKPDTVSASR